MNESWALQKLLLLVKTVNNVQVCYDKYYNLKIKVNLITYKNKYCSFKMV